MSQHKINNALRYIKSVAATPNEELETRIKQLVSEDFVRFLHDYGVMVMQTQPNAAHTLMLLGYMVRVNEEKKVFMQKGANA